MIISVSINHPLNFESFNVKSDSSIILCLRRVFRLQFTLTWEKNFVVDYNEKMINDCFGDLPFQVVGDIYLTFFNNIFRMYAGTIYEIFILPITFKSVSFHHRANYSIKIFQLETHEFKSTSVRPDCSISSKAIDPRTGNMIGVGAEVTKDGTLTTER